MHRAKYLRIIFFLVLSVSLSSCSQYLKSNAKSASKSTSYQQPKFHQVLKGETLYSIAWYYGYDYRQIALWNEIDYPYLIKPNQSLQLYPGLVRGVSENTDIAHDKRSVLRKNQTKQLPRQATKRAKRSTRQKRAQAKRPIPKSTQSNTSHKTKKVKYASTVKWRWPVRGKIVHRFSAKSGKKGLGISGKSGKRIVAAAAGRVVYSGSGLRGYGKLIIIKHNDTYLSAYANNKKILVNEQQKVKSGQHIADMGSNGANKTMLHFEIRKNGKPVNPIRYLPR